MTFVMTLTMTEAKTRPVSFRVPEDVLDALEKAGISVADVARAALQREATKARKLALLKRLRDDPIQLGLGFDVVDFIRRDRDSGH